MKKIRKRYLVYNVTAVCGLLFFFILSAGSAYGQQVDAQNVKTFLQNVFKSDPVVSTDKTVLFSFVEARLSKAAKPEIVVYLTGRSLCGSGGCSTLILKPEQTSFKVVSWITLSRLPICVLPSESHGWRKIAVWVQGGGIQPGYSAVLSFDGKKYPKNPTTSGRRIDSTSMPKDAIRLPLVQPGQTLFDLP